MVPEVDPKQFKARMIDRHRPAFELWCRCHEMLEGAVPKPRDLSAPLRRALDILFVQAFKSHGSLYFLCVHGHGEDGATILRRMFEIVIQARYLCADPEKREMRGEQYLAYFWTQAPDRVKTTLSDEERTWWQAQYDKHKNLFLRPTGHPFRHWWGDAKIEQVATDLGLKDAYDQDYRFLSQMAHCTARGILFRRTGEIVAIRTDSLVREILVFGTRYVVEITRLWNEHFGLIDVVKLGELADEAVAFKFDNTRVGTGL